MKLYRTILIAALLSLVVIPIAFTSSGVIAGIIALCVTLALAAVADRLRKNVPKPAAKNRTDILSEKIKKKESRFDEELSDITCVPIRPSQRAKRQFISDMPEVKFSKLPKDINRLFPLVVLDVETTGLSAARDEIVEVSAIRFEDSFTPASCFTTLCRPLKGLAEEATAVHGITEGMVEDKPCFQEIADQFSTYISGCNIAGYNVLFDLKFLYRGGVSFGHQKRVYDLYEIAKAIVPKDSVADYQLSTICEYEGIFRSSAHRSLSDALATAKLLEAFIG